MSFLCGSAVSHWDTGDWDLAVGIVGYCNGLSEAQWRQITESLPGPRCNAQTISKLVEIPGVVIVELHDAIKADGDQPTVSEMAKRVAAVRESRRFDEDDPNVVGLIEPNFSDREHRTLERTRKLADKAFRGLRPIKGNKPSKGNKRYHPQPEGIDPPTKCALIVSIKLNWPGVEPDKLRPLAKHCTGPQVARLSASAALQIAPMAFGEIAYVRRTTCATQNIAASSNVP